MSNKTDTAEAPPDYTEVKPVLYPDPTPPPYENPNNQETNIVVIETPIETHRRDYRDSAWLASGLLLGCALLFLPKLALIAGFSAEAIAISLI